MTALYIQREGDGPAWQVWPLQDAIPPGSVREASSYLFELRDSDDALSADLLIDDVPLEALRSRQPRNARWRWIPGFHAGSVEAVLKQPSIGTRRFEITIDPDLRKLTREDFDAMVREVLEDTFALFSLSAFRKGIARQAGSKPPPLARLEFMRSRVDEIAKAVAAISRAPRHLLRAEQITVPFHKARRATGPEIIKSFRTGRIRTGASTSSHLPATLCGRLPEKVTMRERRNSVDIPEHRQIKACLKSWASWLSDVADVLEKDKRSGDPEISVAANTWAHRTRIIARKLSDAASAGFMTEVSSGPAMLHMSSLYRNDPAYASFYRLWQDMNLGLAALFGDFLQMPLARTYELYELWCFLRLLRAAVEEYGATGVDMSELFTADAAGGLTICAGAITVPVGHDKILCFQRQYREYWLEPNGEGSFSRTMVPDIVLAGTGFNGSEKQVIVLDAKYRIHAGLNDALSSIHTYRDALVQEVDNSQVAGIVTAAYLLTPYLPTLGSDFKSTPVPGRLFHPEYRERFRFGAVTLRPGMDIETLRSSLRAIVADATGI